MIAQGDFYSQIYSAAILDSFRSKITGGVSKMTSPSNPKWLNILSTPFQKTTSFYPLDSARAIRSFLTDLSLINRVEMWFTSLWRKRTRAIQMSCLSPTEKISPFSMTKLSIWFGKDLIFSFMLVRSMASQRASSVYFWKRSKLYLSTNSFFVHWLRRGKTRQQQPDGTDEKDRILWNDGHFRT